MHTDLELTAGSRRFSALTCGDVTSLPVLCLHGFPDHYRSYRFQLPALAAAGYRAVAPMMRGYEPSSQGRRHVPDFHPLQITDDVIAWAKELGGGQPIHLVGHDWGAIVAYSACVREPELFRSVTTMAVPPIHAVENGIRSHPVQIANSWYTIFFQLRGLADAVVRARDYAFIEKLWRDWSPGFRWEPDEMAALKETFRQPGVLWSALAYYRAMLNPFLPDSRAASAMTRKPVRVPMLAITGATDGCMDTRLYDFIDPSLHPAGLRVERIEGGGHFVHQEKPEEINRLLCAWLAEHDD